ncbi:PREDICTED: uncharacterized protein LOC106744532 isoform X2 [Dinoponera quadriceps]|uniref:Uncharacterized protein LOC106744532 isoform X2 n=1 Tax=Dinoponera quadriceps TaxID=609295 RepID=A0A6P3XAG9_DINQU|nr:PREDICTED: uncharacterized protein LOC106744532 isoform X2 [Dinoponera quadriceps]
MIDAEGLTQEELSTLKSDLVGESAYSARWILGVLKSLTHVPDNGFTDELEDRYILLLEISIEPDVRCFLIDQNFINLAEIFLEYDESPKIIEITIGILVCLCYDKRAFVQLAEKTNTVERIFGFLKCYDSLILIQIFKLVQLIVWQIKNTSNTLWAYHIKKCECLGERIIFILKYSSCGNLLVETISLLHYMSFDSGHWLIEVFKRSSDGLVYGLLECFLEIIKTPEDSYSSDDVKFIVKWLEVFDTIENIPSINLTFAEESKWLDVMIRLLRPYKKCTQFTEEDTDVFQRTVNIIKIWHSSNIKVPKKVMQYLAYVTCNIDNAFNRCSEFDESDELFSILYKVTNEYWLKIIEIFDKDEIIEIMRPLKPWARKYLTKLNSCDEKMEYSKFVKIRDIVIGCALPQGMSS